MRKLKVRFIDFHEPHDTCRAFLRRLLSSRFTLDEGSDPEVIFYSSYGKDVLRYDCKRIYCAQENVAPDFDECDYALSFELANNARNYRVPFYRYVEYYPRLFEQREDADKIARSKTKFCNFVYSNCGAKTRMEFYRLLSTYKKVDSGGRCANNMGSRVGNKLEFMRSYKFSVAFENSYGVGYTTEKILDALISNCIPIYWGNPAISGDFNEEAIIDCNRYRSWDEVLDRVVELDSDDNKYRAVLAEPRLRNAMQQDRLRDAVLLDAIEAMIDSVVYVRKGAVDRSRWYRYRLKRMIKASLRKASGAIHGESLREKDRSGL